MNPASPSPRNLIGLYSAWRLDDEALGDLTERRPDFHIEARIATFAVEPSDILKLSADMARREAFPLDAVETEEVGTRFVDDAIATYMESLDGWFEIAATGNLELARRTSNRFKTLGHRSRRPRRDAQAPRPARGLGRRPRQQGLGAGALPRPELRGVRGSPARIRPRTQGAGNEAEQAARRVRALAAMGRDARSYPSIAGRRADGAYNPPLGNGRIHRSRREDEKKSQ